MTWWLPTMVPNWCAILLQNSSDENQFAGMRLLHLTATQRFSRAVMPLVGTGCLLHIIWGTSIFITFRWYCDVWTNFWSLQKFKISHVLSLGVFSLEQRGLGAATQYVSTKSFNKVFSRDLTKNVAFKIACFRLFSFMPEKPQVDPKTHCFWDGTNLDRWVYMEFLQRLI